VAYLIDWLTDLQLNRAIHTHTTAITTVFIKSSQEYMIWELSERLLHPSKYPGPFNSDLSNLEGMGDGQLDPQQDNLLKYTSNQ